MPQLPGDCFGVAVDLHGCPNRCRHCYLGAPHGRGLDVESLPWVVEQFRSAGPPLRVSTYLWEPDYSPDYRRLYELENQLGDMGSQRASQELLSVWRLARDPEYAPWAHSIGVRVCQISFFGLEEATDWGYRRRGAFQDALTATEKLLAAGIRPRWQWFLTTRLLPDLAGLIDLTRSLGLRERCEALGGPFTCFMHCPGPDGEARHLEHLRPTMEDLALVPDWLREQSEQHLGYALGVTEGELTRRLWGEEQPLAPTEREVLAHPLWFFVCSDLEVYPNVADLTRPWRLGNLATDGGAAVLAAFVENRTPGLRALRTVPVGELARRFGDPSSRKLYLEPDLKTLWLAKYLEQTDHTACLV